MMKIDVLSAGAAQGVVSGLAPVFERETGCAVVATFGAVGAMRQKLFDGEPCDVIILSATLVAGLFADGQVLPRSVVALGRVRTGVAVRAGESLPDVSDSAALKACLLQASALYAPDPEKATAGVHFVRVLEALGIRAEVESRLNFHPNGAAAMGAMAADGKAGALGVTQVTEINNTPGVILAGALQDEHELSTVYSVAVTSSSGSPELAKRFATKLTDATSMNLRRRAGFEF